MKHVPVISLIPGCDVHMIKISIPVSDDGVLLARINFFITET